MSRAPSTFRQRDVSAAIKAAKAAGCIVSRVIVDREGRIVVDVDEVKPVEPVNEWDAHFGNDKA